MVAVVGVGKIQCKLKSVYSYIETFGGLRWLLWLV
jgi:hypothetical protein